MKKFVCILLALSIIFSLSACNINTETENGENASDTTTEPYRLKVVRDNKLRKEFTAADGTVSYIVDATLPQIFGGCGEGVAASINAFYEDMYYSALEMAEFNVENAAEYMKNLGTEKPWTKTISYEVKFCNEDYLCLLISDSSPLSADEKLTAHCIRLKDGYVFNYSDFETDGIEGIDEYSRSIIISSFQSLAENELGTDLTDEQLAGLNEAFDENNFYFDEYSIYFLMQKSKVDPSLAGYGYYIAEFFWSDFEHELTSPIA